MSTNPLSFVFFGTPDVASETLEILKSHGYVPKLIVTAPDRPVGRHFVMTPPAVKVWAIENGIPFIQQEKPSVETLTPPSTERYDVFIVVAYGKILSREIIDMPKYGTFNIHYSLLPRWRGASPVEAAILHGDAETGVSIQRMVFKLDAGPVVAESRIPIAYDDTAQSLRAKLIPLGAELLSDILTRLPAEATLSTIVERVQDESQMTRCGKIKKEDALVDPFHDDPKELWNKYRAYHGWPGIYFLHPSSDARTIRIKITQARFEDGRFIIEKVIPEGKKETNWNS